MNKHLLSFVATLALAGAAHAAAPAGWESAGDVVLTGAPSESTPIALTTASLEDYDVATNLSGVSAVQVGYDTATTPALEQFVGVAYGGLDVGDSFAFEGSAIKQTYTVTAGSTLSFTYNLSSRDDGTYEGSLDRAFLVVDGHYETFSDLGQATQPGTGGDLVQTGWTTGTYTFASAGAHVVSFGVVDVGDTTYTSTLSLANVSVSPVPEAPTVALMLAGLLALGVKRRRAG